jgi:hypothetical protein
MITQARALTPADSKYRLPTESGQYAISADAASDWLTSRNLPTNRPMSRHVLARYQLDMEQGRWVESPVPVIFDTDGYLIDGQHRLKALANAGTTLTLMISVGQSREIFAVLDSGYKRNAAHMITGHKHTKAIAMGARYLSALSDNDRWGIPRYGRISTAEILQAVGDWPELDWYGGEVFQAYRAARIPAGTHTAILAQAARTEHAPKIKPWLDGLVTGENLRIGDPRMTLRNRYIRGYQPIAKIPRRDLDYAQVVRAWNAYVLGQNMTMIRVATNDPLPKVEGFDWANPAKGA